MSIAFPPSCEATITFRELRKVKVLEERNVYFARDGCDGYQLFIRIALLAQGPPNMESRVLWLDWVRFGAHLKLLEGVA